ncbi:MAG TPA: glycosyltransferase family 4 protein [Candidatus Choladousia intestinavium]|uniref:Glycosyltransferase family 4 protein n=1 Tax=Candidatus Choladousia intestinavium TaxID=2840727 RepID=A0A9D1ADL6_9FIRM|nr:glycosyltransferase family 4 protein [Candidatus Choladousia intestinavium]
MKVLITTDWYDPVINGVVTSVHTLMKELENRGHEVRVLTLSRNHRSYKEDNIYYAGSAGAGRIYPEARFRLTVPGKYVRELIQLEPDLIHSQCEFFTFFPARKIARELHIPMIHTYHTIYEDYTHYFTPKKAWGRNVVRRMTRRLSRQVSGIIVPSEKVFRILEEYSVECPLWVVPSGIDLFRFSSPEAGRYRENIRRQYALKAGTTVLLYVGRLAKEKNIEELLAYQKEGKAQGTVLMIVGGGPYQEELERQVRALKLEECVIFTGMMPREEVWKYYQAGDLFVSASTSETQGMTYAEALASGLPLLCRRDECLSGVIEAGKNGWQYEDMDQFFAFLKVWQEQDEGKKKRMQRWAEKSAGRFSAELFGREVEKIYEQEKKREENLESHFSNGDNPVRRAGGMGV